MQDDRTTMLALLDWFRAMGADVALDDAPNNWLARHDRAPGSDFHWPESDDDRVPEEPAGIARESLASPSQLKSPPPAVSIPAARPQTPLAASEAENSARKIAERATTLAELEQALRAFDGCALKATASSLCFYRGSANAPLMLIGEAPGREEDISGKPFVGRAGLLLDKMLAAIGLGEGDVHITNVVYWRPPGNRTPTLQETLVCKPFLERQIELVAPRIILALGGAAAKEVLGEAQGIMRLRGKWREITVGKHTAAAMAILHPAYLLRTPAAKQMAWLDLLHVKARLSQAF